MMEHETLPPDNNIPTTYAPDCCPTIVVCRVSSVALIQYTLFQGWEYRPITGQPRQCGYFLHPTGALVPIYQFGKELVKLIKSTDVVALEGNFVPTWCHIALGTITATVTPAGVLVTAHKYYTETKELRRWLKQLRPLPDLTATAAHTLEPLETV